MVPIAVPQELRGNSGDNGCRRALECMAAMSRPTVRVACTPLPIGGASASASGTPGTLNSGFLIEAEVPDSGVPICSDGRAAVRCTSVELSMPRYLSMLGSGDQPARRAEDDRLVFPDMKPSSAGPKHDAAVNDDDIDDTMQGKSKHAVESGATGSIGAGGVGATGTASHLNTAGDATSAGGPQDPQRHTQRKNTPSFVRVASTCPPVPFARAGVITGVAIRTQSGYVCSLCVELMRPTRKQHTPGRSNLAGAGPQVGSPTIALQVVPGSARTIRV